MLYFSTHRNRLVIQYHYLISHFCELFTIKATIFQFLLLASILRLHTMALFHSKDKALCIILFSFLPFFISNIVSNFNLYFGFVSWLHLIQLKIGQESCHVTATTQTGKWERGKKKMWFRHCIKICHGL